MSLLTGDASVLTGSQKPRVALTPEFASSTGPEAVELAALAGLKLDAWQQMVLTAALGERLDGRWAAFEVGVCVPRQNGKGGLLEARELAGLFLLGERLLIHSAHEQKTSSEHFRRLLGLIEAVPEFSIRVKKVSRGKGDQAIELFDDQRIMFVTRTGGGGRGLSGDFVALDEAMILPEATIEALVPTMAARSMVGNPQLWYAGSAVDQLNPKHDGVVFARVRERALKRAAGLVYAEWSLDYDAPDDVPEDVRADPRSWAATNPGFNIRIGEEHVEREHAGALGPRGFAVERLGVGDWPSLEVDAGRAIPEDRWRDGFDAASKPVDPVAFGLDMSPDRSSIALAVAGWRPDGLPHVEIVARGDQAAMLVQRAAGVARANENLGFAVDAAGQAASLIPDLVRHGVNAASVAVLTGREYTQACGRFYDAVDGRRLRHLLTPELTDAVAGATWRNLGEARAWNRRAATADIAPLVAATLALWQLETGKPKGSGDWWML